MNASTPRSLVRFQDLLVRLLGNTVGGRRPLVAGMLRRDTRESTSYWLQLVVSVGIATLGLVVGSTAVVIGAMLVAPLMGPIVGLGMGLATGSPFLVLRSAGRVGFSVLVAVGGAALITLLLPFHEMNLEISARTSPTVLDLITAGFCALAGVYASVRPGSDTTTTAAGTAISVSLVPPLCASGYGIGTAAWSVAGGAALLFLTNLVAIVFVGTAAFVASGFNRVDVVALEHDELGDDRADAPIARALALRLARVFASRWGPILRFLMPFLLLAAVYVPLRRALDEMAWEVRVRAAVRTSLTRETARVIERRVRIERHEVELVLVLLGTTRDADRVRARLDREIRRASGIAPHVEILAVPDATAFAGLESTLFKPRIVETPAPTTLSPGQQLEASRTTLRNAVDEVWPKGIAGEPLVVDLDVAEGGPVRIRVVHLGAPLSADGADTLRRAFDSKLGRDTLLVDVAVPPDPFTRERGDLSFVAGVAAAVRSTAGVPAVSACVVAPPVPASAADAELTRAVEAVLQTHQRVTRLPGDAWSIRFVPGSCPEAVAPDGGKLDAGTAP